WRGRRYGTGSADQMNRRKTYVVSSSLKRPDWDNTTVISGDVVGEVSKLKQQRGGDVLVNGSCELVRALIENDLVDELRVMVFPIVLGMGKRPVGDSPHAWSFRLVDSRPVGRGGGR